MKERLKQYVTQQLLSDRPGLMLGDDDNLLADELIDSLGMMRLVSFIEDALQITVPPEDVTIENFVSINAIDDYLGRRSPSAVAATLVNQEKRPVDVE